MVAATHAVDNGLVETLRCQVNTHSPCLHGLIGSLRAADSLLGSRAVDARNKVGHVEEPM
jgi:hypothetical protein